MSKSVKIWSIVFGVFIGAVIIGTVAFVSIDINREPTFSIEGNTLKVSDTYAKSISLIDAEIAVVDKVPALRERIVGTSVKNLKKGRFSLSSGEEIYLSLVRADMKCILIDNGKKHYINCISEDKTLALYDMLLSVKNGEDEY